MALIEDTLEGVRNRVNIAIERLKSFEPPEGYYLAFSGGKDSIVIYKLAQLAGIKFDAHYNFTTVDPPELLRFIKENYKDVEWHRPRIGMFKLIEEKLMPPTRMVRYCCGELKERGGKNRFIITGIKKCESSNRANRKMIEVCYRDISKKYINPIIDWQDSDVWEFIKLYDLEYCCLYNEGFNRIGCVMCPLPGSSSMLKDKEKYPNFYKAYLRSFRKMIENRKAKGKKTKWKTAEEVMNWWIYNPGKQKQDTLFN